MTDWTALRQAMDAATPGPWRRNGDFIGTADHRVSTVAGYVRPENADFIALARTALPEMLALLVEAKDYISQSECGCYGNDTCWRCDLIARLP